MEAVVGVNAKLIDELEGVFAPVLDVDKGVVERGAVVAGEAVNLAEHGRGGEDVGSDDLVEEALEFAVGELNAVERLELFAEILFQCDLIPDIGAQRVFEVFELLEQVLLDFFFF